MSIRVRRSQALTGAVDLDLEEPHYQLAPDGPFTLSTLTPVSGTMYFCRFIPKIDRVVTGLQIAPAVDFTADDSIRIGAYEPGVIGAVGELSRVIDVGSDQAGRLYTASAPTGLNSAVQWVATGSNTGQDPRKYSIAVPRVLVLAGRPYYAALRFASYGGTGQLLSANLGIAGAFEASHSAMTLGLVRGLSIASTAFGATVNRPIANQNVPLIGVSYQKRIAAIGDSITGSGGAPAAGTSYYPRVLGAFLGPHAYLMNLGIGGRTTSGLSSAFATEVTPNKPQQVIVLCGVNDILNDVTLSPDTTAGTIEYNLKAVYDAITAAGATGVLVKVLPFGGYDPDPVTPTSGAGYTAARETVRQNLNTWIAAEGAARGWPVVDADSAMATGSPLALVDSADGLHPNTTGAGKLAKEIFTQAFASTRMPALLTV